MSHLPYSIKVLLESAQLNHDGELITDEHLHLLKTWQPVAKRNVEIPFLPSRVIAQDYTGVPLLVDLATMRDLAMKKGIDPASIEPKIPIDLVIDHSLQTNKTGFKGAHLVNLQLEFSRNKERYAFIKWAGKAFKKIRVFPPGSGIVHQLNLEYIAKGIVQKEGMVCPDTVIGTDSHTTMINGLGIVGWGVGGIEAEAIMLGLPVYMVMPDVIAVNLIGRLRPGVSVTDALLRITQILREKNVVGKIVEFVGEGAKNLSVPDRCTIANMAPDYGATMGLFHVDRKTLEYYSQTGRNESLVCQIEQYYRERGWFEIDWNKISYTETMEIDLNDILPGIAGPKLPSEFIELKNVKTTVERLFRRREKSQALGDGSIVLAAITSCTNTSNPELMLFAGLLAKKAVEKGLSVSPKIKTSLTPGSLLVTRYLEKAGLQDALNKLGFFNAGYGCASCAGNVGDLDAEIEREIITNNVLVCSVLSGNRNFEARIHPKIKANFLMSPALVIAFAIAGRININLETDPLGQDQNGQAVYLKDIWPSSDEVSSLLIYAQDAVLYKHVYSVEITKEHLLWDEINSQGGANFSWDNDSTYLAAAPYIEESNDINDSIKGARALAILGDFITTDHISPVGKILPDSPAGIYLQGKCEKPGNFNSFGARRGHHEVMVRGAFSNSLLKNKMVDKEGGYTVHQPSGNVLSIYDAAIKYQEDAIHTLIFAGKNYGGGSSRDWAAKGTRLLGVKAVIAESFERIHRSNLIGMGVLPCQLPEGITVEDLCLTGEETFDLDFADFLLFINRPGGVTDKIALISRLDTQIEHLYYQAGGILPFLLNRVGSRQKRALIV